MKRIDQLRPVSKITIYPVLWLVCLVLTNTAYAGDEDMNPTIYQQFDPETGFMIPIESSPQQGHNPAPSPVDEASMTGPAQATETVAAEPDPDTAAVAQKAGAYPAWIPVLAGLIGLGVLITLVRKKKPSPGSRLD